MMKKYFLLIVMLMAVGVVRGQGDVSKSLLRKVDSCLNVGNCNLAKDYYDDYVNVINGIERSDVERRIGECWIRKSDSCLMYGMCDEAFDYYNFYRTMAVRNDKKMENRIAECMRGVDQSTHRQSFSVNSLPFNMILVKGGSFEMGGDREGPVHKVTLSDYYIGETEVTQALWTAVMGTNPSVFKGDSLPVENVNYNDVMIFIQKLNEMTGMVFRLPTEAEWEYAARGGQNSKGYMYSGSNEIDLVAWCCNNSGDYYIQGYESPYALKLKEKSNCRTQKVKSIFLANELGVFDMSGNVWEWCADASYEYGKAEESNPQHIGDSICSRVCRGGSWDDWFFSCRSTSRRDCPPDYGDNRIGFRLAMTSVDKTASLGEKFILAVDSCLKKGDCKAARDFYEEYVSLGGKSDSVLAQRIADCEGDTLKKIFHTRLWGKCGSPEVGYDFYIEDNGNKAEFKMIYVKGGSFMMGAQKSSPSGANYDPEADDNESPVHRETVGDFYISETEVTQALWMVVMGNEPTENGGWTTEYGRGENYPVYNVSYADVQEFIAKLNEMLGEVFWLPTEAQWEYAARGGNNSNSYRYSGSNYINNVAWYFENSESKMRPVKEKRANGLGLYDMSGNVREWCSDWLMEYNTGGTQKFRVLRGGSFLDFSKCSRVSHRNGEKPSSHDNRNGFRLVMFFR